MVRWLFVSFGLCVSLVGTPYSASTAEHAHGTAPSSEAGVVPLPENWLRDWGWGKFPGIILSAMLLSLGAPFWYNALKNLVRLRPLLAMKEEAEREERQTQQAKAETPAPTSSRSAGGEGERGDLSATGAAG